MKTKFALVIIGIVGLFATRTTAQNQDQSYVKILPSSLPGVIKVFYALETEEPLDVRFLSESEVLASDRIKGSFPNGVSKRYNVKNIQKKDYWIEVSSPRISVTYHIVPSKDGKSFTPYLEKTTYNQVLVKANN